MIDPGWVGGITEARHVLSLASTFGVPVAPHDCTGPVVLTVGTHLGVSHPGVELQEMVRAFYYGWYADMLTELPIYENGYLRPNDAPGLGTALQPEIVKRKDAKIRWSKVG
jgi:L-alanine-DL-glutamate epimerase-like enolase superfamily enzyme